MNHLSRGALKKVLNMLNESDKIRIIDLMHRVYKLSRISGTDPDLSLSVPDSESSISVAEPFVVSAPDSTPFQVAQPLTLPDQSVFPTSDSVSSFISLVSSTEGDSESVTSSDSYSIADLQPQVVHTKTDSEPKMVDNAKVKNPNPLLISLLAPIKEEICQDMPADRSSVLIQDRRSTTSPINILKPKRLHKSQSYTKLSSSNSSLKSPKPRNECSFRDRRVFISNSRPPTHVDVEKVEPFDPRSPLVPPAFRSPPGATEAQAPPLAPASLCTSLSQISDLSTTTYKFTNVKTKMKDLNDRYSILEQSYKDLHRQLDLVKFAEDMVPAPKLTFFDKLKNRLAKFGFKRRTSASATRQ